MLSIVDKIRTFYKNYFIAPKILYTLEATAVASVNGLRPLLFGERFQMDMISYGMISGVMSLFTCTLSPLCSFAADRYHIHRQLLLISMLLSPTFFLLLLIPLNNIYAFLTLWFSYMISTVDYINLMDSLIVKMLMKSSEAGKELYGRQRMMFTLASSFTAILIGYLVDCFGYNSVFISMGICSFLLFLFAFYYFPSDYSRSTLKEENMEMVENVYSPALSPQAKEYLITENDEERVPPLAVIELSHIVQDTSKQNHPIKVLLSTPEFMYFLLIVFSTGLIRSMMGYYLFIYIKDTLNTDRVIIGVFTFFGVAFELVALFFGKFFLRKFSIYSLMLFSICGAFFNMWGYYFTPFEDRFLPLLLFFELGKGINFGFMHVAGVQLCNTIAPKGLETTAQTIYSNVLAGPPAIIAGLAGGYFIKYCGMQSTFLTCAIISTVNLIFYLGKGLYDRYQERNKIAPF